MSEYPKYAVEVWKQNEENGSWVLVFNIEPVKIHGGKFENLDPELQSILSKGERKP